VITVKKAKWLTRRSHHRECHSLSRFLPTLYQHYPIGRASLSVTLSLKMLSHNPTLHQSSPARKQIAPKSVTHHEISIPSHPTGAEQPQGTRPVTNNAQRNTRKARCVTHGPTTPREARQAPSPQPLPTGEATAPRHSHSPAPPHPESPTPLQPDRYPPCAPAALPASTGPLAGSRPIRCE
jgi:hypothetical protein